MAVSRETIIGGEYKFRFITKIEPDRDRFGRIKEFYPQDRYLNEKGLSLHRYGRGPFCRFQIPSDIHKSGVYFIKVDKLLAYVGECQSLSERFNSRGYGTISPRNCYEGGQPTNCRLNNLILQKIKDKKVVELWFFETKYRKKVEDELKYRLNPVWNL